MDLRPNDPLTNQSAESKITWKADSQPGPPLVEWCRRFPPPPPRRSLNSSAQSLRDRSQKRQRVAANSQSLYVSGKLPTHVGYISCFRLLLSGSRVSPFPVSLPSGVTLYRGPPYFLRSIPRVAYDFPVIMDLRPTHFQPDPPAALASVQQLTTRLDTAATAAGNRPMKSRYFARPDPYRRRRKEKYKLEAGREGRECDWGSCDNNFQCRCGSAYQEVCVGGGGGVLCGGSATGVVYPEEC